MSAIIAWSTALVAAAWLADAIVLRLKSRHRSDVKRSGGRLRGWYNLALALFVVLAAAALLFDVGTVALGPAAPLQALGLLLAIAALVIGARAGFELGDQFAAEPEAWAEQELVTRGLYGLVRHPIYMGTIAMWIGVGLGMASWLLLAVGLAVIAPSLYPLAAEEERFLVERFGQAYRAYQARVPMLLPWPRPLPEAGTVGEPGPEGRPLREGQDIQEIGDIQIEKT